MSKFNDGGLLSPGKRLQRIKNMETREFEELYVSYPGATLWDYYAGQAQMAIIFHTRLHEECGSSPPNPSVVANMSFNYADAMIAEREKRMENE